MKLKFEGITEGTLIKAFSFKPMKGRPDSYMLGEITGETVRQGAKMYVLNLFKNVVAGRQMSVEGDNGIGYVPMEVAWGEFDNRITVW